MTHCNDIIVCEPRSYRLSDHDDYLTSFRVVVETSDLYIRALSNLSHQARILTIKYRAQIEDAIKRRPKFLSSLEPMEPHDMDSPVALRMINSSRKAGVGPMASVAGAVAEFVGRDLLRFSDEVIVENGGDVFVHVKRGITVGIHAGSSVFADQIGIKIGHTILPLGICTSSAKMGPSTSFGRADASTVVSFDTTLADAVATAMCNRITTDFDLEPAVSWAQKIDGVIGALAILDDKMAVSGNIELTRLTET